MGWLGLGGTEGVRLVGWDEWGRVGQVGWDAWGGVGWVEWI